MQTKKEQAGAEREKPVFSRELLCTYRDLLQSTDLQRAYQEFIRLFRYLRGELERQMPDYRFQSNISENAMAYAYFSCTDSAGKTAGLKYSVVFVHAAFRLEVWISGVNRSAQCRWAKQLGACPPPAERAADPAHADYLVRLPVEAELSDGEAVVAAVRKVLLQAARLLDCGRPGPAEARHSVCTADREGDRTDGSDQGEPIPQPGAPA